MKHTKKFLTVTLTMLSMLFCLTCYAELADEEFSAEKLYAGDPFGTVTSLYGKPVSENMMNNKAIYYEYETPNGKLKVREENNKNGNKTIGEIRIEEGSNCKTYSGAGIGTTMDKIKSIYGTPTFENKDQYTKRGTTLTNLVYNKPMPEKRLNLR